MMRYIHQVSTYVLSLIVLFLTSCQKEGDFERNNLSKRTVMVYLAANNNLVTDAYQNINQMEASFQGIDGRLIVYARLAHADPALYEISYDLSAAIKSKKVKTYQPHNSSDPQIMKMVFEDIQKLYPAESYGAILWSHATSWVSPDYNLRLRSFGDDAGLKMDIKDLKVALPGNLDYLIFDACSMGSVEVLYELKDKADYILASPTEVAAVGMPYDRMMKDLFSPVEQGLKEVGRKYFEFYEAQEGIYQSGTISLIDARQLRSFAQITKGILDRYELIYPDMRRAELQRLDFIDNSPSAGFDLLDFMEKNFAVHQLTSLYEGLNKLVLYKAHTKSFNNKPIEKFCGLSCYIPVSQNAGIHPYYKSLLWYQDAGFYHLFDPYNL